MRSSVDGFMSVFTGKHVQETSQVDGPQEGRVSSVDVANFRAVVVFDKGFSTDHGFTATFGRTSTVPQVGDRALCISIGDGIENVWLISWAPS